MPHVEKIVRRLPSRGNIVEHDAVELFERGTDTVDKHQRARKRANHLLVVVLWLASNRPYEPVNSVLSQHIDRGPLSGDLAGRLAQQHCVAARMSLAFHLLQKLDIEEVVQIVDHQADKVGLATLQAPRNSAGPIAQFLDSFLHPLEQDRNSANLLLIQNRRDRAYRNVGAHERRL